MIPTTTLQCEYCGKMFERSTARLTYNNKHYKHIFCGRECSSGWLKGKPYLQEAKDKISAANKGKIYSAERRRKMSLWQIGRRLPADTIAKLSGANNHNWQGGISQLPYSWDFTEKLKEEVRSRDGHKCQLCGSPQEECSRRLCVHHIDYDKTNSDPVNLISLCIGCHVRTNKNRSHWKKLLRAMMIESDINTHLAKGQ